MKATTKPVDELKNLIEFGQRRYSDEFLTVLGSLVSEFRKANPTYDIEPKESEWISIDERLPSLFDTILISITNDCIENSVSMAMYQYGGDFIDPVELMRNRANARPCVGVTHWMPLPAPPVTESE